MWSLRDSALFYLFFKIIKCSKKEKIKKHFKRMIGMTDIKLKRIGSKHEREIRQLVLFSNSWSCSDWKSRKLWFFSAKKVFISLFSFWVEQKMGDNQKNGHIYFSSPCWCNFFSSSAKITLFYFCLKDQLLGIGWLFLKFY